MKAIKKMVTVALAVMMMAAMSLTAFASQKTAGFYMDAACTTPAPMGQGCIKSYTVNGSTVNLKLGAATFDRGGVSYAGYISQLQVGSGDDLTLTANAAYKFGGAAAVNPATLQIFMEDEDGNSFTHPTISCYLYIPELDAAE